MSQAARIRSWLTASALPLWASAGVDPQGGFVERLRRDGTPDTDAAKRVRVQARQIYVFAHAGLLGLFPHGTLLARRGFNFLMAKAWLVKDGGFAHLLDRGGAILDSKRDAYDHACVLFAFAWLYRATRDQDVLAAVEGTLAAIDRHLGPGLGYLEDDRGSLPRRQNPHMHLLEAFLAAHEATGEGALLDRATEIVALFDRFFVDRAHGALVEYYTQDWRPAAGEAGRIVEPGHHFEWIWLLHEYARLKKEAVHPAAKALYDFAIDCGVEPGSGLVVDEVFIDGKVKSASKRCWPQTEALKAELALAETAGSPIPKRADAIVDNIFRTYLDPPGGGAASQFDGRSAPVAGGWIDSVDASNAPIASPIPASIFYHLFMAFAEYLRLDSAAVAF
jgi:mannose/cellobiose epimerase-like protein (N-acyl-D-glucosamine 2-epimerase family)